MRFIPRRYRQETRIAKTWTLPLSRTEIASAIREADALAREAATAFAICSLSP